MDLFYFMAEICMSLLCIFILYLQWFSIQSLPSVFVKFSIADSISIHGSRPLRCDTIQYSINIETTLHRIEFCMLQNFINFRVERITVDLLHIEDVLEKIVKSRTSYFECEWVKKNFKLYCNFRGFKLPPHRNIISLSPNFHFSHTKNSILQWSYSFFFSRGDLAV